MLCSEGRVQGHKGWRPGYRARCQNQAIKSRRYTGHNPYVVQSKPRLSSGQYLQIYFAAVCSAKSQTRRMSWSIFKITLRIGNPCQKNMFFFSDFFFSNWHKIHVDHGCCLALTSQLIAFGLRYLHESLSVWDVQGTRLLHAVSSAGGYSRQFAFEFVTPGKLWVMDPYDPWLEWVVFAFKMSNLVVLRFPSVLP